MGKKVPVNNDDRKKSFFKYYAQELAPGDPEKYAAIASGPQPNETANKIQDRNDLFLPGYLPGPVSLDTGFWKMEQP